MAVARLASFRQRDKLHASFAVAADQEGSIGPLQQDVARVDKVNCS